MLFGHNSNLTIGTDIVHVQTEDRGASHAFIDTTVHWKGPRAASPDKQLSRFAAAGRGTRSDSEGSVGEQHRAVIDEYVPEC